MVYTGPERRRAKKNAFWTEWTLEKRSYYLILLNFVAVVVILTIAGLAVHTSQRHRTTQNKRAICATEIDLYNHRIHNQRDHNKLIKALGVPPEAYPKFDPPRECSDFKELLEKVERVPKDT